MFLHVFTAISLLEFVNEFWVSLSYFVPQCITQMSSVSAYWLKNLQRVS